MPGIAFTPPDATAHFAALAPGFELAPQIGATLGERLDGVLSGALARGYGQVAAVNSDSPSLPVAFLVAAFVALDDPAVDVVLGPCDDGGYYLIGWKRPHPALVRDVTMSAPDTLAQTLAVAGRVGLRVALLPRWYDVDGPPDLARLAGDPGPVSYTHLVYSARDIADLTVAVRQSADDWTTTSLPYRGMMAMALGPNDAVNSLYISQRQEPGKPPWTFISLWLAEQQGSYWQDTMLSEDLFMGEYPQGRLLFDADGRRHLIIRQPGGYLFYQRQETDGQGSDEGIPGSNHGGAFAMAVGSDGGAMWDDYEVMGQLDIVPQGISADLIASLEGFSRCLLYTSRCV